MMIEIAVVAREHYLMSADVMPDTLLRASCALSHLILLAIPGGRLSYHFTDEETNP